jgi:hypothetical protein
MQNCMGIFVECNVKNYLGIHSSIRITDAFVLIKGYKLGSVLCVLIEVVGIDVSFSFAAI